MIIGNPYDYLAKDKLGKYSINFGIYGIPESILIDENLMILKKFIGPITEKDYIFIKKIIKNLMKKNFNFVICYNNEYF